MKNKIMILFAALITQSALINATDNVTEPSLNPKETHIEYCTKFLPNMIEYTTKQSNTEKNAQKKEKLNKQIGTLKAQLETGKCKETENKNCQDLKTAIDTKADFLKRNKLTQDNKQLDTLKNLYKKKNCK